MTFNLFWYYFGIWVSRYKIFVHPIFVVSIPMVCKVWFFEGKTVKPPRFWKFHSTFCVWLWSNGLDLVGYQCPNTTLPHHGKFASGGASRSLQKKRIREGKGNQHLSIQKKKRRQVKIVSKLRRRQKPVWDWLLDYLRIPYAILGRIVGNC